MQYLPQIHHDKTDEAKESNLHATSYHLKEIDHYCFLNKYILASF